MRQGPLGSLVLVLLLQVTACSVAYDADDFGVCELPTYETPPCEATVAECLAEEDGRCRDVCDGDDDCLATCLGPCYDADGDGALSGAELECARCVGFISALRCYRETTCQPEVDSAYCCVEALCDPNLGCGETACSDELTALGRCAVSLGDEDRCGTAYRECFTF